MNSIEKQFKKRDKKRDSALRSWWRKNDFKVARVLLFFIWIPYMIYKNIKDNSYNNLTFDTALTKRYLDRVLPKMAAQYEEDSNLILFHDSDDFGGINFYWNMCSDWMAKNFRKETRYFRKFNREVKAYIVQEYIINGYEKLVLDNWIDWDRAKEKFGWGGTPYNKDYAKGVVFYK